MRDPKRIRDFLDVLAHTWERVPDYRFGQLIINLSRYWDVEDIWELEEPEWIEMMHKFQAQFYD